MSNFWFGALTGGKLTWGDQGNDPLEPGISVSPEVVGLNAGGSGQAFTATRVNSTETINWTLTGVGTLSGTTGESVTYTPPASVSSDETVILTARLGTTGPSASATIAVAPSGEVPTEPVEPVVDFSTWTAYTIPPQSDWVKYASLIGNPQYDNSALSATMRGYIEKAYIYHQRLQLTGNQTVTLPDGQTRGYINSGIGRGFGLSGGGGRSWSATFREGSGDGMISVRLFSRLSCLYWENALNLFMLTHDLRWLDIANWYFKEFLNSMYLTCDARESWSNGRVTVRTSVNNRGYPMKDWLMNKIGTSVTEAEKNDPRNWSKMYYRNFGIVGSVGHGNIPNTTSYEQAVAGTTSKGRKHYYLGLPNNVDSANKPDTNWGVEIPLEDMLLHGTVAKHLRALYLNRERVSPKGYNYAQDYERCRHYMEDHFEPKWRLVPYNKTRWNKYNGHPLINHALAHAHTQHAKMYYHLYKHALEKGTVASSYFNAFEFLMEPLASDAMRVDLSGQYSESQPGIVYPHFVGNGGYHRPYDAKSHTWRSQLFNLGEQNGRRYVGTAKMIYFDQTVDACLDLWLSRYWQDIPADKLDKFKMRNGKNDARREHFLYSDTWMWSVLVLLTYQSPIDPSDGSRTRRWKNSIQGVNNWFYNNRHNLETLGGGSGDHSTTFNLNFILDRVVAFFVMFDDKLTGVHKDKVRRAFNAEKAAQGGWGIGDNGNMIPNTLELLDALINKQK